VIAARGAKARAGCPLVRDLAKAAGVGPRTVENDETKNGAPFRTSNEYLAWRAVNRASRVRTRKSGTDLRDQKLQVEIAKLHQEVRAKEIDNRVRNGELVSRDAVERWLSSFATEIRQSLESLPALIVSEVPGDVRLEVNDVASEQVRLLLVKLSQMRDELWSDETLKE